LRQGDTLVVTRVDRLARSIKDLQDIVYTLKARGVTLQATEQPIDTHSAAGKAFLDMLGVFAEFETNLRRVRMAPRMYGDPRLTVADICHTLRISLATFYRYMAVSPGRPIS
jgi:DNA invertase Pin-like site-specific DNA recombinase